MAGEGAKVESQFRTLYINSYLQDFGIHWREMQHWVSRSVQPSVTVSCHFQDGGPYLAAMAALSQVIPTWVPNTHSWSWCDREGSGGVRGDRTVCTESVLILTLLSGSLEAGTGWIRVDEIQPTLWVGSVWLFAMRWHVQSPEILKRNPPGPIFPLSALSQDISWSGLESGMGRNQKPDFHPVLFW